MKEKKVQTVFLIVGYFIGFEKYGIDVFYNRKYQKWLVDNSTDAESLNSDNYNFHVEYDERGFITNARFNAFHNSIPLTENDFIATQIRLLNKFLDLKDLKNMELIQIQHFKIYLEKRVKVIEEQSQEHNKSEHSLFDKLDQIRFGESTDYEITLFLKQLSNNYDADLLKSLQKDIEFYLFVEKDIKESEFNSQDIENAIKKRLENGLEIPYYKRKPLNELTDKQIENRKKLDSKGALLPTASINYEELLFPFEFFNIYRFKNAVINKISDLQKVEPQQREIIQQKNEMENYFKSYKQSFFSSHVDKKNNDGKENLLFYGKMTAQLLNHTDQQLKLIEYLRDKYDLLSAYNKHLYYLITHTIHLYKTINEYRTENNTGYKTAIFLKKESVFNSLKSIRGFSEKIKDEVIHGNIDTAITIKNYFLLKFDVWISFLDDTIGIDVYESPLKTDFEEVKLVLENAINLDELKIKNDFREVLTEPRNVSKIVEVEQGVNFKNNFDSLEEAEVFKYFKTNLVEKKHLSMDALNNFLNLAFDKKIIPEQKISFEKLHTKESIVSVFYRYYKIIAGNPYGRQTEYFHLLKNYFKGFEKINIRNFSKK